jgi:preprotein translocase subunit SecA
VDYVVKSGSIEMVDEFKGRIAQNRRWPDSAAVRDGREIQAHPASSLVLMTTC